MPYLTSSQTEWVKLLALISMVLDHIGFIFDKTYPYLIFLRTVGRFAFLAFGFIIALNLSRPQVNFANYFKWMLITALISETCQRIFHPDRDHLNILFQFLAVVGVAWVYQRRHQLNEWFQGIVYGVCLFLSMLADYSLFGLLYCLACYTFFQTTSKQNRIVAMVYCIGLGFLVNYQFILWFLDSPGYLILLILSIALTLAYLFLPNGIRSNTYHIKRIKKGVFYAFYPLHLLILDIVKQIFIG